MNTLDDTYEYEYVHKTQDISKFDIFINWFWLMLGLGQLLTGITFIVLKLFGILSWAWWIILSPICGFISLITLIVCFIIVGAWISEIVDRIRHYKKRRKEKDQK